MDTPYTSYPQLFDIDDSDLFQGLNLSEQHHVTSPSMYNTNNDYFSYLHNNNVINNDFLCDTSQLDMYYFNQQQQKQYNWLYDPTDTNSFLTNNQQPFRDENTLFMNMMMSDTLLTDQHHQQQQHQLLEDDNLATVQGGMSRDYVSLNDVNSFVAKADSMKHSSFLQLPSDFGQQQFSSEESTNSDEEDCCYSDQEDTKKFQWPSCMHSSFGDKSNKQKLMIKIKKPAINHSALPSPYGEPWNGFMSPSKSATTFRKYQRKSMSNIFANANTKKMSSSKLLDKRRGSAPHRLTINHNHSSSSIGSLHSSSSLSSLTNNLQRSMRVSDSMHNFLSDDEDEAGEEEEEVEEEDDDEYRYVSTPQSHLPATKKGRNVDKACNHCKRSHLRCDDMRPCRRCVATGKTGCKDVQHKPRGRPKLHKK